MKTRVIETGEIVEVNQCSILYDDGRRELIYGKELEEVQGAPDYWERLKHQYAGMMMQGMFAGKVVEILDTKHELVDVAIFYAAALVEKLKNE